MIAGFAAKRVEIGDQVSPNPVDVDKLQNRGFFRDLRSASASTRRQCYPIGLPANRLVRQTHWPIVVQKTGYIVESGHCMAMVTRIGKRAVTLVLLDSGSMSHGVADARRLRAWAARHAAGK